MKRGNRQRGRHIVLWAAGIFAAVQLGAGLLLDRADEVRFPELARALDILSTYPHSPQVVSLGSSRLGCAFRPLEVERFLAEHGAKPTWAFNACISAGDLITADRVLERLLEQGVRPETIIVEVSPETLARRVHWMGDHVRRHMTWGDCLRDGIDIIRCGKLSRLAVTRLAPVYAYRRSLWRWAYQGWQSEKSDGPHLKSAQALAAFFPNLAVADIARVQEQLARSTPGAAGISWESWPRDGTPWELWLTLCRRDPEQATLVGVPMICNWLRDYRIGGAAPRALERLLERAHRYGIRVELVAPPLTAAQRALYTTEIEAAFQAHIRDVVARHGCGFHDYRSLLADSLLADNHHVNLAGAVSFSRTLVNEVLAARYRGAPRGDTGYEPEVSKP